MKNHLIAVYTIILSVVLSSCGGIKGIEYTNYSQRKFKSAKESNNFLLKHGSSSYSKEIGNLKYDVKHTIARFPYLIDATIVNSYLDKLIGQGKKSIIVNSANGSRVVKKSKFNRVKISQNWDKHEMEIKDYNNGNHLLISVKNKTNPIVKINKGFSREKNFITKSMKDVYGFKNTYKNSEHTEQMLKSTLEWVLIEDVIKILKLYPNTKTKEILVDKYILLANTQEDVSKIIANIPDISLSNITELKIKYYELSKNVVDLKKAKRLYPEVEEIQKFDICPHLDKLILTSSKEELDYIKMEYGNSNCKTQIDNAVVTTCLNIDNCFELAKQYSELKIAIAKRSLELVTSLDDCIKINTEFPEINAETGKYALDYASTFEEYKLITDHFPNESQNAKTIAVSLVSNIEECKIVGEMFPSKKKDLANKAVSLYSNSLTDCDMILKLYPINNTELVLSKAVSLVINKSQVKQFIELFPSKKLRINKIAISFVEMSYYEEYIETVELWNSDSRSLYYRDVMRKRLIWDKNVDYISFVWMNYEEYRSKLETMIFDIPTVNDKESTNINIFVMMKIYGETFKKFVKLSPTIAHRAESLAEELINIESSLGELELFVDLFPENKTHTWIKGRIRDLKIKKIRYDKEHEVTFADALFARLPTLGSVIKDVENSEITSSDSKPKRKTTSNTNKKHYKVKSTEKCCSGTHLGDKVDTYYVYTNHERISVYYYPHLNKWKFKNGWGEMFRGNIFYKSLDEVIKHIEK